MSKVVKKPTNRTKHSQAGITFSVARVRRHLREADPSMRQGVGAAVYLAAVLEYLSAEVLELSGKACKDNKKKQVTPRHITLAVYNDDELRKLMEGVIIAQGGVIPHIESILLPKATKTKKGPAQEPYEKIQSQEY